MTCNQLGIDANAYSCKTFEEPISCYLQTSTKLDLSTELRETFDK